MAQQETLGVGLPAPAHCECSLPEGVVIDDLGIEIAPRDRVHPVPEALARELAPAALVLNEWCDYTIRRPGADELLIGNQCGERITADCFRVRLENRLGLTRIRFLPDGRQPREDLWAEVVSPKFPSPAAHLSFLTALLDDLFLRAARLPFEFDAATSRQVAESLRPPSPLFTFHFLCNHARTLDTALRTVLASPHRALLDERRRVPIGQATEVDADTIQALLFETGDLGRAPHLPVARALGGYAPSRVWQRLPRQSFDTPENRFVLAFLRSVQAAVDALPSQRWWGNVSPDRKCRIQDVRNVLNHGCLHPMWEEVGEMASIPASSQVLVRREGYRDLRLLWQLFHQARRPLFAPLQSAIDLRDVASLYEFWVFFRLCEEIGDILQQDPVLRLEPGDREGLGWTSRALFGGRGELRYNQTFRGGGRSYSVSLRPDYTWLFAGKPTVVLDAKFRMSWADVVAATDPDETDEGPSLQRQTVATREDLYKMHTYRDALKVRAAVAIYPGDTALFCSTDGSRRNDVTLREILLDGCNGIGAIPMQPGQ